LGEKNGRFRGRGSIWKPYGCLSTDTFLHRLPYGTDLVAPIAFLIIPHYGLLRQRCSFSYANRFGGNAFTEQFPSSSYTLLLINNLLPRNGRRSLSVSRILPRNRCCFGAVR
jgi:hypothetical protein